jgi:phage shock protein C
MGPRRLYRSRTERQIAGVAGGIGNYLEVDPTVIRVLWILSVFFAGIGILLYIILAFVVPLEPLPAPAGQAPAAYVPAAATPPPVSQPPAAAPASDATTAENPASQTDGS